jgi:hypothetical protein
MCHLFPDTNSPRGDWSARRRNIQSAAENDIETEQLTDFFLLDNLQLSFFLHNSNFYRQPSSLRVQRREQMDGKMVDVWESLEMERLPLKIRSTWRLACD